MTQLDSGTAESRLRSAVAAGDWNDVYALLDEAWNDLFENAPQALLAALDAMPDAVIAQEPKLRLAREYIARGLRGEDQSTTYRHSIGDIVPLDVVDRLAVLTDQIVAARSAGRGPESIRLVAAAHELLAEQAIERGPHLVGALPDIHHQWGLTLERAGELEDALLDYAESFDWAISGGNRIMQTTAAGAIAYLHALHGRITLALTWLEKQAPAPAATWWSTSLGLQSRLAAALVRESGFEPPTPDPLEGVEPGAAGEHWAPYFFVRALAVTGARRAHLLRHELDAFQLGLNAGQRSDPVSAEYVDVTRLVLAAHADRHLDLESDDRPTATASLLRQLSAATRALRLARAGKHRQALQLTAPLLQADGSRPRVLILALVAHAISTRDPEARRATLSEAATIAQVNGDHSAFLLLPHESRLEAAAAFDALGAVAVAQRLRAEADESTDLRALTLTRRERAVVEQAIAGASTAEIATALSVSVNTVKSQLRTAYRKLDVSSRSELLSVVHPRIQG